MTSTKMHKQAPEHITLCAHSLHALHASCLQMRFINMPTFCPVVCPQQRPPACAAAGCRTAQCPWAEQLHAVREGALWGPRAEQLHAVREGALWAQRALQEDEQGELNSEGLGRIRVLVAEGARGPHPARQLPSRPPLLPCWSLPVQLAPRVNFLPPPLPLPLPRVSAPRLPCPLLPVPIPKFCTKLNLK